MGRNPPISTTPTGDVMISYWNTFQRISAVDLPESGLNNKILIWGLTAEGLNNPVSILIQLYRFIKFCDHSFHQNHKQI